jgi:hypothetical protein
MIKELVPG